MAGRTLQYRHNEACHRLMLQMPTVYDTNCMFRIDTIVSIVYMCSIIESSSTCGSDQLTHDTDGHIKVPFYDWTEFLKDYYKSLPSISKYHIFSVTDDHPYNIILQEHCKAEKESLNISKLFIPEGIFPKQIHAKRLG